MNSSMHNPCFAEDSTANESVLKTESLFKANNSQFTEGGYESSYSSRRSNQYSTDGYSSSRPKSDLSSSKYDTSSYSVGGGSKYESLTSKYSRDVDDTPGLTSTYTSRKPISTEDDGNYSFSRKSIRSSAIGASDDGNSYSYSRKISSGIERDTDPYSSYTKRTSRSISKTDDDFGDGDSYSYKRRSVKSSQESGTGDGYSVSKYSKSSISGTGLEPISTKDSNKYSSKKYLESDLGSKYSVTVDEGDHKRSRNLRSDGEEYISKYSSKYSTEKMLTEDDEDDKYAKYKRKYSRTESLNDSKTTKDDVEEKYSRKFSRTTSRDKPKLADEEEDAYEKYARKYLRKESTTEQTESSGKLESDSNISTKISKQSYLENPIEVENAGKYKVIYCYRMVFLGKAKMDFT